VAHRQIGNAVPPALAEFIGLQIRRQLLGHDFAPLQPSLVPRRRESCPEPEPLDAVPNNYLRLAGAHKPHPGTGKGPAPQQALARSVRKRSLQERAAEAR
jgi:DNA (cytosine-5)-methyltransferase 1